MRYSLQRTTPSLDMRPPGLRNKMVYTHYIMLQRETTLVTNTRATCPTVDASWDCAQLCSLKIQETSIGHLIS